MLNGIEGTAEWRRSHMSREEASAIREINVSLAQLEAKVAAENKREAEVCAASLPLSSQIEKQIVGQATAVSKSPDGYFSIY